MKIPSIVGEYNEVFNPQFKGYNIASRLFKAVVNMGPVQLPQRIYHIHIPYPKRKLEELQRMFDELERLGVLDCPELTNINVKYIDHSL